MKIRLRRIKKELSPSLGDLRKSKSRCPLSVGDRIEEIASGGLQVRVGEDCPCTGWSLPIIRAYPIEPSQS